MKALKASFLVLVPWLFVSCATPAAPSVLSGSPTLLSPPNGAVLDNGCNNPRTDSIVWEFDWSDVPGATRYRLIVEHVGSAMPTIDVFTASSFYARAEAGAYIIERNRFDWQWRVEAEVNGVLSGPSVIGTFSVEPLNADCP